MKLCKPFANELILVHFLSVLCFVYPLATFNLKTIIWGTENYGSTVRCFYFTSGLFFIFVVYILLIWHVKRGFIPCTLRYKISYVILNLLCLLFSPILLIAFFNSNFSNGIYEGVLIPIEFIGSAIWILFWDIVSLCCLPFCSFPQVLSFRWYPVDDRKKQVISVVAYLLTVVLATITLYHFYKGRFYVGVPEFMILYTMLSDTKGLVCNRKSL